MEFDREFVELVRAGAVLVVFVNALALVGIICHWLGWI